MTKLRLLYCIEHVDWISMWWDSNLNVYCYSWTRTAGENCDAWLKRVLKLPEAEKS